MSLVVVIGAIILYLIAYVFLYVTPVEVIHSKQDKSISKQIAQKCQSFYSTFWPFPFIVDSFAQTILPSFIRREISSTIKYDREIYQLEDGGTVALDWVHNDETETDNPLIILICPGLTGTSKTKYICQSIAAFTSSKIESKSTKMVVFNYRGLGIPLTSPKSYNGCDTTDLGRVVEHINKKYPNSTLFAVGYSLGSNLLTKYVGEQGDKCKIHAAVSVCNPYNFNKSITFWKGWRFKYLLGVHLTRFLRTASQPNIQLFQQAGYEIDETAIMKASSLVEFDEFFTIKIGGWKTVAEYYHSASSEYYLHNIKIPMLFINANDDPLSPKNVHPLDHFQNNDNLILCRTKYGGHLGWCTLFHPTGKSFADLLICDFFEQISANTDFIRKPVSDAIPVAAAQ